jgi:16S rRNA C967 or C1407 C5-methylase (RsmB/RsmF family)/NOL1/NOP2/fmu family ribosome biogenesis protein
MILPKAFEERIIATLGKDEFSAFKASLEHGSPTSIRINKHKFQTTPNLEQIPWCASGFYLPERPNFSSDPLWHSGAYYVQEASSMLLEQAFIKIKSVNQNALKILDLCAAPGGKSTHLASLCNSEDLLVANEIIKSRVGVLSENIKKQGHWNTIITSADSKDFAELGELFDVILVDAPCSGEGLFRKDHAAMDHWNSENIQVCELRQKRILNDAIKCLKPNGYLIYSTCTYNPGENQNQIEMLLNTGFESVDFTVLNQTVSSFQCYPHQFKGEGFFISLLMKTESYDSPVGRKKHTNLKDIKPQDEWMQCLKMELDVRLFNDKLIYSSSDAFEFFTEHLSTIYCSSIGCELGTLKSYGFTPSEYLPFSLAVNQEHFSILNLDQTQALHYLNKQIIPHSGNQKGYVTLAFKENLLGFGKFAGNRINNLFPSEWRLRKLVDENQYFNLE